jgi:two-component system osmolarity sensor histidine kinase EnvZ
MLGIIIAGWLLILITTILLVRRITHPITTLSKAVSLVGSGQLTTKIPEAGTKELVILARNFNKMTQEITQLISNRNILFGGISHDLRTPITRMQIALELIEDTENSALIKGMRNDLEEMENLIKQALELVKGMSKQHAIKVEINEFMLDAIANYQRQSCIIEWEKSNCGSCKLEVNALRRVLCNLLDNAFRYSGQKPVQLSCSKSKNKLIIRVMDQGPGIPADQLDAVFQPFYRLDISRNKKTGGSGLGLAIVQQLCDIHHWKVQLLLRKQGCIEARLEIPIV